MNSNRSGPVGVDHPFRPGVETWIAGRLWVLIPVAVDRNVEVTVMIDVAECRSFPGALTDNHASPCEAGFLKEDRERVVPHDDIKFSILIDVAEFDVVRCRVRNKVPCPRVGGRISGGARILIPPHGDAVIDAARDNNVRIAIAVNVAELHVGTE